MAESLSHTFGQIVGHVLEAAIEPELRAFARKHALYLDTKGRRAARKGTKVTWSDVYGNTHDLDYVLEKGGTDATVGTPVAFIETAWRRYTKHSRNKAQEIQGAVSVLALTHRFSCPFLGAILGGVFTDGALNQLKSLGFQVLYFPYESIVEAFKVAGVDARFGEDTPEREFRSKIRVWKSLSVQAKKKIADRLLAHHQAELNAFLAALDKSVGRGIERIIIIPLHGAELECATVAEAIASLSDYDAESVTGKVYKYEIEIRYNNADKITAEFGDKAAALAFLAGHR